MIPDLSHVHVTTAILPAIIAGASLLGKLFGGASKGRAEARQQEATLNAQRDQTALQRFLGMQNAQMQAGNLDLARKDYETALPGKLAGQSVRGDLLATLKKPAPVTHPRANVVNLMDGMPELGANSRALGSLMSANALKSAQTPPSYTGGQLLQAPNLTPLPQAGKLDKFLNWGSAIGLGADAYSQIAPSFRPKVQMPSENAVPPSSLAKLFSQVNF